MPQFKVADSTNGTFYDARILSRQEAADLGVPGATHRLTGGLYDAVGTMTPVTGRIVKVPGWSTRRGVRAVFSCGDLIEPLTGYLTVDQPGDDVPAVRGCSCGEADYGAPGHDGHGDALSFVGDNGVGRLVIIPVK